MLAEDEMTINERRKYLKKMWPRYQHADRGGRSHLLTEMEQMTDMHCKRLIRLRTSGSLERRKRTTPRRRSSGLEVAYVVEVVWESLDYLCAECLTPTLLPTVQHLVTFGELHLPPTRSPGSHYQPCHGAADAQSIPPGSPPLPSKGPAQANHLRQAVPMERLSWQVEVPGYVEVDLVHHSGDSSAGDYVHTLQLVDSATG